MLIRKNVGQLFGLMHSRVARLVFSTLGVGLVSLPVTAHDFWLQPSQFWVSPGAAVPMTFLVGHGGVRQRTNIGSDRFNVFRTTGPGGVTDRKGSLSNSKKGAEASLSFAAPGTYVAYFSTSSILSELPSLRFNDYAAAEGLTLVTRHRAAQGKTDAPGREFYSRRGKALLQVGLPGKAAQPQVTAPVGLSLEIVPLVNPYQPGPASSLPVQVLYQGRPLAGALVKLNDLNADERPVEVRRTDTNGRADFQIKRSGLWQLNVVWSQPLVNNRSADFLTTFSSLSFGFNRPAFGLSKHAT